MFLRLEDSRFAQYLRDCCVEAGFIPRISQQVVEAYSLTSLVAGGLGVALVPESIRHLARRGVIYRPLCEPAPAADVKMVFRPDGNPVVARFVELARELLLTAPSLETVVAQAAKIRVNKSSGDDPPRSGKHEQGAVRKGHVAVEHELASSANLLAFLPIFDDLILMDDRRSLALEMVE